MAALGGRVGHGGAPFIGGELRPDLRQSALLDEPDGTHPSGPIDKRAYDSAPPVPPVVGP